MEKIGADSIELNIDKSWSTKNEPFHFFGPCSAESELQMDEVAKAVANAYPKAIFRAGVWKPRTRPSSFQGIGEHALEWLQMVKEKYGLQTATEVASPIHLDQCLKAGIDVLWIGARTTVNPFAVQAIADALKGVDVQVFVKNPINPDLSLWMGALERINKSGITKLGAIHRGFHLSDNAPYRNSPLWNLAVQLKTTYQDLPIICDASHISGKRQLIPQVVQKSVDLDMDGLMLETHSHPEVALSDKEQQLSPTQLKELIENIVLKKSSSHNREFQSQLEILRTKIDTVDDNLLDLLAVRMDLSKQIGVYKKQNKVTILQLKRWHEILGRVLKNSEALGLSEYFIQDLFNLIHGESIRQQTFIQFDKNKTKD